MKKANKFAYFLTTMVFFLWVDFYFSNLIAAGVKNGWEGSNGLVNFVYVKNTGAAFSIMQDSTGILIAFSTLAVFLIIHYIIKNLGTISFKGIFFLTLLLSGILGNLYERIFFGYVRDFFDLTFVSFPVFNISDIFINIGVFGIIILILLSKKPVKLL